MMANAIPAYSQNGMLFRDDQSHEPTAMAKAEPTMAPNASAMSERVHHVKGDTKPGNGNRQAEKPAFAEHWFVHTPSLLGRNHTANRATAQGGLNG